MTKPVVGSALVRVGQHGIGFADFLELLLCVRIIWIAVRMVLEREFAIRALQFDFGYGTAYAEYLVVIAFCVRGQSEPFVSKQPQSHPWSA